MTDVGNEDSDQPAHPRCIYSPYEKVSTCHLYVYYTRLFLGIYLSTNNDNNNNSNKQD